MFESILYFFKKVLILTAVEVLWVLSFVIIFGFLLYILASRTRLLFYKSFGVKGELYATGFIGVPIHEMGHLIFCLIFRHKVESFKLLDLNATNGVLGYVNHGYQKNSLYQNIGNFFIGVGPIIFGTVVLYALINFMLPSLRDNIFTSIMGSIYESISSRTLQTFAVDDASSIVHILFDEIERLKILFFAMITTTKLILSSFTNSYYTTNILFWLFIYLSMCIASHMELSPPDISHVTKALLVIVVFVLFVNSMWIFLSEMGVFSFTAQYINIERSTYLFTNFLAMLQSMLVFALVMSAINFVLSAIVLNIIRYVWKKEFLGI